MRSARQLLLGSVAVSLLLVPAAAARAQTTTPQTGLEVPQIGSLKLGKASTVIIVFATDCKPCLQALPFYKKLMALPGMDGVERRMNMMTTDGALPGTLVLEANGLT